MTTLDVIPYGGWSQCCRLSNGLVEVFATVEVGPRLIRFGFAGGGNILKEYPDELGQTGGAEFRFYGGHRLWHAPESRPRTYYPDNEPVGWAPIELGARLTQAVEATTGIQKEIEIRLPDGEARVELTHRLRNTNLWPVRLAPWALTALAPGGTAILPLPAKGEHAGNLLPAATLALWAYTDMQDKRWTWGNNYVLLRQDPARPSPQKIGASNSAGWLAYARAGLLFVKRAEPVPGALYPDLGCAVEMFANGDMLELETLGPLMELEPGAAVTHTEHWSLHRDVPTPETEAQVEQFVAPRLKL